MKVEMGHSIRNASGNFGCPNCWNTNGAQVNPLDAQCPQCHVPLEWTDAQRLYSMEFEPYRRKVAAHRKVAASEAKG